MSQTTVLVFGEDRTARMEARRKLLARDYVVRVASSMAEAAKAVAAGGVDVIVLTPSTEQSIGSTREHDERVRQVRDAFSLPVVELERGSVQFIVELVRTAAGAHESSRHQDGRQDNRQDGESE